MNKYLDKIEISHQQTMYLLMAIVFVLLIALLRYKLIAYNKKRKQRKRFERGNELEIKARGFLESKGYKIISEQEIHYHKYSVNGKEYKSKLILDYVVEKSGKKYIVEVKSGQSAVSLHDKNSRRQLLEYDFVIENDGVFLLDMESKNMQKVNFDSKKKKKDKIVIRVVILLGLIATFIPFIEAKIVLAIIIALFFLRK
ncbi:MAG: hypothetical protein KAG96_03385 [Ichthyobacteriaceae bacterium]|nr:hypothetical protein [Ichthyobacteriaceae bacterium]